MNHSDGPLSKNVHYFTPFNTHSSSSQADPPKLNINKVTKSRQNTNQMYHKPLTKNYYENPLKKFIPINSVKMLQKPQKN